jgi:hypothetical protein
MRQVPIARPSGVAALAVTALLAGCATAPAGSAGPAFANPATFCTDAQQAIAGTTLVSNNVVHAEYASFVASKPVARPLETEQYSWYEDDTRTEVRMISCKMKTVDHLRSEYGEAAASGESTCAAVNGRILALVRAGLSRAERRQLRYDRGTHVVFEADELTTDGLVWLKSYDIAWVGVDGALHVKSKAMRNDWLDPRYVNAPAKFKGTRYCHLVAPSHMRRLLLGTVTPPSGP